MALPHLDVLTPSEWPDYALIDSGDGEKLERFGAYTVIRPEPEAMWSKRDPARWRSVAARFALGASGNGDWTVNDRRMRDPWTVRYHDLTFVLRRTPFRHTGLFPEQEPQWRWLRERLARADRPRVLNLFGYTGAATLVAAAAGAQVTHVDASKQAITWARDNQARSGLDDRPVRWILDDARKFVRREQRRGQTYDGVIMDPPVYGRGPNGEVWRFTNAFPSLLDDVLAVVAPRPLFLLITTYAVDVSPLTLHNVLQDAIHARRLPADGVVACGELGVREEASNRVLSLARTARWSAD